MINWKSSSYLLTTDWIELYAITATIATPRPKAVAISAEPIPSATAALDFPVLQGRQRIKDSYNCAKKPRNGATPPTVPKMVKCFSVFLQQGLLKCQGFFKTFFCTAEL